MTSCHHRPTYSELLLIDVGAASQRANCGFRSAHTSLEWGVVELFIVVAAADEQLAGAWCSLLVAWPLHLDVAAAAMAAEP